MPADNTNSFDLLIIGSGPAGYVGAIKAGQLGMKVGCVEGDATLGGTCLNVGCIPSKSLLHSSHLFESASEISKASGSSKGDAKKYFKHMMTEKKNTVSTLNQGIAGLFKKNNVERINGFASLVSTNEVKVGKKVYKAKNIILATGSKPTVLPGADFDEKKIISSTGALSLSSVPKNFLVIGGGYIGLELGSVFNRLGSKVTVIESGEGIIPTMDSEIAKEMGKILEKQGMNFMFGSNVEKISKSGTGVSVICSDKGKKKTVKGDCVLVSIGRKPYSDGLGLEKLGIEQDERGFVKVNDQYKTNVDSIYAVGDLIGNPMLAHKAEEEAVTCVEMLAGQKPVVHYDRIPSIMYTNPEVASVGYSEEQLKEQGVEYKKGKVPFMANSRARSIGSYDGFVKVLAATSPDGRILGMHIVGPDAGNLIHEGVIAMEFGASAEDIARSCHGHPTLNEAVKEACIMAYAGKALNY